MNWIFNYMIIGVVATFLFDMMNRNNPDPDMRFSMRDRFTLFTIWPIAVFSFVYHFFKAWFNDNE